MSKRLLPQILFCQLKQAKKPTSCIFGVAIRNLHTNVVPVKEIQIPVQWGHMAGKLWGHDTGERPILALHGWQDNAGTWDPLAPLLHGSYKRPILALDFPGHGLSSWIPPGMHYYSWELPRMILYVKEYFKWDKVSLLAHSMGSIASFRYSSLFPEDVDFYIAIDSIIYDDYDLNLVIDKYPKTLRKLQITQKRLNEEPPAHTMDELITIWHLGTGKSVDMESVPHLTKRGTKQSSKDLSKYYFSRDSRLKHILFNPENKKFVEAIVRRSKCPTLYIKGTDSPYASDSHSVEMREILEENNVNFECHFLPGTHHLHLNSPELVLPVIIKFLQKHQFLQSGQAKV